MARNGPQTPRTSGESTTAGERGEGPKEVTRQTLLEEKQWEILRYRFLRPGGVGANEAYNGNPTVVTLPKPEPDTLYGVLVTPGWNAFAYVTAKNTTTFTVTFSATAGANTFDWIIFRRES